MANGFQNNAIFWVEVDKIKPNPYQPRKEFDEAALQSLADSIKQYGVLQPLVVTRKEEQTEDGGLKVYYELVAGERRLRASKLAGLNQVPVLIRDKEDTDQEKLELAIIENLQREDLNPIDKALAFKQLYEKFKMTHAQIAQKVGKSREYVSNALRLLSLPEDIQRAIANGIISEGHARPLLMLSDKPEEQQTLFKEITMQKLTVREAEHIARSVATDKVRKNHIPPKLRKIEKELTENLGTRVRIEQKDGQVGRVHIDFTSEDDLYHLLELVKNHGKHSLAKSPKLIEDKEGNANNPELPKSFTGAVGLAAALGADDILQQDAVDNNGLEIESSDETNSQIEQSQSASEDKLQAAQHENQSTVNESPGFTQSNFAAEQYVPQNNENSNLNTEINDIKKQANKEEEMWQPDATAESVDINNNNVSMNGDQILNEQELEQNPNMQNSQENTQIDLSHIPDQSSESQFYESTAETESAQTETSDATSGHDLYANTDNYITNQAMDISQFSSIQENEEYESGLKDPNTNTQVAGNSLASNEPGNQNPTNQQNDAIPTDRLSAFEQKIDQMIKESKEKDIEEQKAGQVQYPSGVHSDIKLNPELENLEQKMQADISAIMQNPSATPASISSVETSMQDEPKSASDFSGDSEITKQIEAIMQNHDSSSDESTAELGVTFNEYKEEQDTMPGFDGETLTPAQKAALASNRPEENVSFNADAEDLDSLVRKSDTDSNDSDLYSVRNF